MIARRDLLVCGLAGLLAGVTPAHAASESGRAVCAACLRAADGGYRVALFDAAGTIVAQERLPGRGHGLAVDPVGSRLVIFARRPGRFALVLDRRSGRMRGAFEAPAGRHFYGHGVFSPDARLLYAPENDYESMTGVIGVYDAGAGFRRVDELPGGGIGPHEVVLMPDGDILAVAVGGIATQPDTGRRKLNLATMAPALVYLDRHSGAIRERVELAAAWHRLSLRHLVVAADRRVWIGGQYEGPQTDRLPLLWNHRRGEAALRPAPASEALWAAMRHYVGSVAVSADGLRIVATSPRGGIAATWESHSGRPVDQLRIADVCGAAALNGNALMLSDGQGQLWRDGHALPDRPAGIAWDNHMAAL